MANPRNVNWMAGEVARLSSRLASIGSSTALVTSAMADWLLRFLTDNPGVLDVRFPLRAIRRSRQFRVPLVDRLAHKAAEGVTGWKLPNRSDVSASEVNEADDSTLRAHSSPKTLGVDLRLILSEADQALDALGLTVSKSTVPLEEVPSLLPTSSSSCWPDYLKKGDSKAIANAIKQVTYWSGLQSYRCAMSMLKSPCTMFHRFTSKLYSLGRRRRGVETKVRQIFGVPHAIMMAEVHLFGRLLEGLSKRVFCYGYTRPELSYAIRRFDQSCRFNRLNVICGDITKMDTSIHPLFLLLLFARFGELIGHSALLRGLLAYHVFSPVISSTGRGFVTFGGNNTGTRLTTIINTFTLLTALRIYYVTVVGKELPDECVLVHGDDFLLGVPYGSDIRALGSVLKACGLELKPTSSLVSSGGTIDFLGFHWINYEPTQTVDWVVRKIVYPERGEIGDNLALTLVRLASICFQVVGGSELFDQFADKLDPGFLRAAGGGEVDLWVDISKSGRKEVRVPLETLRSKGWRCF